MSARRRREASRRRRRFDWCIADRDERSRGGKRFPGRTRDRSTRGEAHRAVVRSPRRTHLRRGARPTSSSGRSRRTREGRERPGPRFDSSCSRPPCRVTRGGATVRSGPLRSSRAGAKPESARRGPRPGPDTRGKSRRRSRSRSPSSTLRRWSPAAEKGRCSGARHRIGDPKEGARMERAPGCSTRRSRAPRRNPACDSSSSRPARRSPPRACTRPAASAAARSSSRARGACRGPSADRRRADGRSAGRRRGCGGCGSSTRGPGDRHASLEDRPERGGRSTRKDLAGGNRFPAIGPLGARNVDPEGETAILDSSSSPLFWGLTPRRL